MVEVIARVSHEICLEFITQARDILEHDFHKHQNKPIQGNCQCYDCGRFVKYLNLIKPYDQLTEEQKDIYRKKVNEQEIVQASTGTTVE